MGAETNDKPRLVAGVLVDAQNKCGYCHGNGCHVCGNEEVANVLKILDTDPDFYNLRKCAKCGTEVKGEFMPCPNCLLRVPPDTEPSPIGQWSPEYIKEGVLHIAELVKTGRVQESEVLALWDVCFDSLMETGHFERDGARIRAMGIVTETVASGANLLPEMRG